MCLGRIQAKEEAMRTNRKMWAMTVASGLCFSVVFLAYGVAEAVKKPIGVRYQNDLASLPEQNREELKMHSWRDMSG